MTAKSTLDIVATTDEHDLIKGTPWEKRGKLIPKDATAQEALKIAGLDWKVAKARSILIYDEPVCDASGNPTYTEDEDGDDVLVTKEIRIDNPKGFGLVRTDDRTILSPTMGNRYKAIQNDEAFEVFYEFVNTGGMTMETAGSFSKGKHIWGMARVGESFELADGEIIEGFFLLMQSHKYGHALKAMFTPIRFPGGQTIVRNINLPGKTDTYSMPHSRKFNAERKQEIHQLLGIASNYMAEYEKKARFLARTRIPEKDAIYMFAKLFDQGLIDRRTLLKLPLPQTFEELEHAEDASRVIQDVAERLNKFQGCDMPTCRGTAWGAFTAVVDFMDHERGHNTDTRLERTWIGSDVKVKKQALDLAGLMAIKN
jgi:phage/plasmid-like protein (TIGR03299 family)